MFQLQELSTNCTEFKYWNYALNKYSNCKSCPPIAQSLNIGTICAECVESKYWNHALNKCSNCEIKYPPIAQSPNIETICADCVESKYWNYALNKLPILPRDRSRAHISQVRACAPDLKTNHKGISVATTTHELCWTTWLSHKWPFMVYTNV